MYEARQNKEKVSRRIEGGSRENVAQFTKVRLIAKTTISTDKNNSHTAEGQNNGQDKDEIVTTIASRNETNYIAEMPKVANPMGACAEPHALAAALKKVDEKERIKYIWQYPAIADKPAKVDGIRYKRGDVVPGCATCKQWAPGLGDDGNENSYVKVCVNNSLDKAKRDTEK